MDSKKHLLGMTIGLLPLLSATSAEGVSLTLDLSSDSLVIGQPLTVNIVVSELGNFAPPSLSAMDLDVTFDSNTLAFVNGTFGNLLGDINNPLEVPTATIAPSLNTVNLVEVSGLFGNASQCSSLLGIPLAQCQSDFAPFLDELQPDSFVLASLTFDTIGLGTSPLSLAINTDGFLDAEGIELLGAGIVDNQSLTIFQDNQSVPEPSFSTTFIFIFLGLIWTMFRQQQ